MSDETRISVVIRGVQVLLTDTGFKVVGINTTLVIDNGSVTVAANGEASVQNTGDQIGGTAGDGLNLTLTLTVRGDTSSPKNGAGHEDQQFLGEGDPGQ